jgi:hypothetical protein
MSEDRILAVDLMNVLNAAVAEHRLSENAITYSEILFALRVCAAVVVSEIPESHRTGYVQDHMMQSAEMLGIPLIPMEVDAPDRGKLN